jgi:hypothetical protein
MSGKRMAIVGGGVLAIAAAVALFVLALDVLRWRGHLDAADLRFAASSGDAAMWEPETVLPTGVSRSLLALEDDLAYRRAVQRFRVSRIGQPAREQNDVARKGRVEAELARLDRTDGDERRRSLVANLQGAVAFEEARDDSGQAAVLLRRSLQSFRRAIARDPGNEDAKYNLELVLRLLERVENESGPGGGGERGDTRGSGAGAATAGSGY